MTRPSRSRIFPRGAGMGKDLMRLRSACSLYSWGFWTCRFQKPVIRNRKMRTPAYWKKAIFPAASLTSSRRACLPVELGLFLALIVNRRILQLMFEEAFVRVPAIALRIMAQQRKVQTLDRLGTLLGQLRADTLLFLQAGNLMTTGTTVEAHQELAARLQVGIVEVIGVGIRGGTGFFAGLQIAGDVARLGFGQPQAGHRSHLHHQ